MKKSDWKLRSAGLALVKKQIIRKPLKRYEGTLQKFKMYRVLIPIKVGPPLVVPTLAPCPLQEFNLKTMAWGGWSKNFLVDFPKLLQVLSNTFLSTSELDHYTFQPWFQFVSKRPQAMVRTANSGYGHRKLGKLIRNFGRSFRNGTMMNEKKY